MSSASSLSSVATAVVTGTVSGRVGSTFTTTFAAAKTQTPEQSILNDGAPSPTVYDPSNPIVVFIIQAFIIISLCSILGFFLKRLRQPRVISEVLVGIILGPTAMGRIHGFTQNIFPSASIPGLNLVANIGLILFLFIVGLETDIAMMRRNWRAAAGVGFLGLAVPFGVGAGVARGLYDKFIDPSQVSFGHFLLFIAVAFAITAFPVLCRILTELKLLKNSVGLTTLAAGVFNDVVGWILLALAVTLVNSGSGATAVYVLLCVVGWALVLFIVIRPAFTWLARKSGSFNPGSGPSQGIVCLAILLTFASAWFTQVIGVHAIFGGFLAGLAMPRQGRFPEQMTEKIEDLVTVFFLPLYFTLSGLKTNLGLLNDGTIWGWFFVVFILAVISKFVPCALAARFTPGSERTWREAGAVGSLMACKGLVELIVLNIGLNAGILNPPVFAMFVLMALLTTFITTPLTVMFYPESYRLQRERETLSIAKEVTKLGGDDEDSLMSEDESGVHSRFAVVLNRLEDLASMMAFTKVLQPPFDYSSANSSFDSLAPDEKGGIVGPSTTSSSSVLGGTRGIAIDALRLVELSNRYSVLMAASETDEAARQDPLCSVFRTFANLNGVRTTTSVAILPPEAFGQEIANFSSGKRSDMVIIPWCANRSAAPAGDGQTSPMEGPSLNPFERLFNGPSAIDDAAEASPQTAALIRSIFADATCDVGLFLERGSSGIPAPTAGSRPWTGREHIFFAFHGGPDDRTALALVLRLCRHPGVSATVVRVVRSPEPTEEDLAREAAAAVAAAAAATDKQPADPTALSVTSTGQTAAPAEQQHAKTLLSQLTIHGGTAGLDTIYGTTTSAGALQSETADNLAWERYFGSSADGDDATSTSAIPADAAAAATTATTTRHPKPVREALARIRPTTVRTAFPLATTLARASRAASSTTAPVLVVVGRSRRGAPGSHAAELLGFLKGRVAAGSGLGVAGGTEARRTLGDLGSAVVVSGIAGAALIVQSGHADRKPALRLA